MCQTGVAEDITSCLYGARIISSLCDSLCASYAMIKLFAFFFLLLDGDRIFLFALGMDAKQKAIEKRQLIE